MKYPLSLQILTCFSLSLFLWNCSTNNNEVPTAFKTSEVVAFDDCTKYCKQLLQDSFAISKDCAECMLGNFKKNGYRFKLPNDTLFSDLRGFGLHSGEVVEIARKLQNNPKAEIFTMMGIYYGVEGITLDDPQIITTPELILVVKTPAGSTEEENYEYFNFTQPCPNFCPGGPGGSG